MTIHAKTEVSLHHTAETLEILEKRLASNQVSINSDISGIHF